MKIEKKNFQISGAFSEFGEFMSRDNFFNSMQSPSNNSMNNSSASSFPIGTFSIEQTTQQQQQQQPSAQPFPQTDYFNAATANQLMSNGVNGTGSQSYNNAGSGNVNNINNNNHNNNNSNNNAGADPNQATTRETGIIEKLLVCYDAL